MTDNSRTTLILIMLIVSVAAQFTLPPLAAARSSAIVQPFSGPSVHLTYWLNGSAFQNWNNSRSSPGPLTTATDGDNVTIMLLSTDGFTHSWFLDLNNNTAFDPTESNTRSPDFNSQTTWKSFNFTVRLGLLIPHGGNFTYRCVYHLGSMFGPFKFYAGPVASFSHAPTTPLVGTPVSFDATTSWPSTDQKITNYKWDFADGNKTTSTSPAITHTYTTDKTYMVILNITDTANSYGLTSQNVKVLLPPPTPFDYTILVMPTSATMVPGQASSATVTLSLTSGASENVTLTTTISPGDSTFNILLNRSASTNGFPPYTASLNITSSASTPRGTYTVTVRAVSDTGVAHNATFTLTVKPPGPETNYLLWAGTGAAAAIAVLSSYFGFKRSRARGKSKGGIGLKNASLKL